MANTRKVGEVYHTSWSLQAALVSAKTPLYSTE